MPRPRRILGYARVSSEEQARGTSLQDQQNAIAAYAKGQGLRVTRFYVEAESGIREKVEKRLQMQALMRDVREGDLVLVDKVDRWSRDPEFTYRSVREILERKAGFIAIGENIDASTPDGDSALGFRILFAKEEHKRIRQRLVGTRHILRDKGYWVEGVVPYGYVRTPGKGLERNVLIVDEQAASVVRRVFRLAIQGRSITEIASAVGMKRDRVMDMLGRRFYVGELRDSRGNWIAGKHPALIDAATFARAREAVGRRTLRVYGAATLTDGWILRDVAVCGACGSVMTSAYGGRSDRRQRRYYYRCARNCQHAFIRQDAVEAAASDMVLARLREMREELARPRTMRASAPDFAEQRAAVARKRARLLDAFAAGVMTVDELRSRTDKLDDERLRIDAEEQRVCRHRSPRETRAALRELATLEAAWRRADGPRRRGIVRELVVRAALLPGEPPAIVWREAEDLVAEE